MAGTHDDDAFVAAHNAHDVDAMLVVSTLRWRIGTLSKSSVRRPDAGCGMSPDVAAGVVA